MPAYTNAKQTIPALFQEIIRNQKEQDEIKNNLVTEFARIRELKKEMAEYRRTAEAVLHWNANKGK